MTDREACPECGEIDIRKRVDCGYSPGPSDDKTYRCRECSATFDTPVIRDIDSQPPRRDPARTLWLEGLDDAE